MQRGNWEWRCYKSIAEWACEELYEMWSCKAVRPLEEELSNRVELVAFLRDVGRPRFFYLSPVGKRDKQCISECCEKNGKQDKKMNLEPGRGEPPASEGRHQEAEWQCQGTQALPSSRLLASKLLHPQPVLWWRRTISFVLQQVLSSSLQSFCLCLCVSLQHTSVFHHLRHFLSEKSRQLLENEEGKQRERTKSATP
jgi:hypothetical protein